MKRVLFLSFFLIILLTTAQAELKRGKAKWFNALNDVSTPLSFEGKMQWEVVSGDELKVRFLMKAGSRDIQAFELYVYATDVWDERIYGSERVYYWTTDKKISAGAKGYSDFGMIPERKRIRNVYCGIKRVKTSDGAVKEYTLTPDKYEKWEIKK